MEQRLMPDCLDMREITFTNLLLLGFEPSVYEAKYKCPFNRDMFAFPNKKAMEAVFYFLFAKLNPDVARDEFRSCWPIYDKKQESAFRKVAAAWLNRISKEIHDSHLPRVVASVLLSPGGDKFYHLLFCFSSFVLKEDLKKCVGKGCIILPWPSTNAATKSLRPQMSKILRTKTACETRKYLELVKQSTAAQDEWISYSTELTKENRKIRKKLRELERSLKDIEAEHLQRGLLSPATNVRSQQNSPYAGDIKSLKRTKIIQRVRDNWNRFNEVYESQKILRERIDEMMKGTSDKYCLKGTDIKITVPDVIIRDFDEEIYQRRIGNTYEGGKVNILSLVQLWNLSLHLLLEQFKSYPLPHLGKDEANVRQELHNQSGYLENIKSLKEILNKEMIPELKDSIDDLKEMIYDQELQYSQQTPKAMKNMDFSLVGLPATPSVHLKNNQAHETQSFAFTKELFPNENVPTPEAVEKMMQSLRDMSLVIAKESAVPDEKPAKTEPISKQQRIPVRKSTTALKQQKNKPKFDASRDDTFKKPRIPHMTPMRQTKSDYLLQNSKTPISEELTPKQTKSNHRFKPQASAKKRAEKAQDILADKIVSSVLSQRTPSSSSSSNSSRCTTPQDHGLADPLAAISDDAFHTKNKLPRTPLVKVSKEVNTKGSPLDELQSYLSFTTRKESASPHEPVRLFSESFTESPVLAKTLNKTHTDVFANDEDMMFAPEFSKQKVVWNTPYNQDKASSVVAREVLHVSMEAKNENATPKIPSSSRDFLSKTYQSQKDSVSKPIDARDSLLTDASLVFSNRNQQSDSTDIKTVGAKATSNVNGPLDQGIENTELLRDLSSETPIVAPNHKQNQPSSLVDRLSKAATLKSANRNAMKDDLSDIINRYRILKSKSKNTGVSQPDSVTESRNDSNMMDTSRNKADEDLGLSQTITNGRSNDLGLFGAFDASKHKSDEDLGLSQTITNGRSNDLDLFDASKNKADVDLGLFNSPSNLGLFQTQKSEAANDLGQSVLTNSRDLNTVRERTVNDKLMIPRTENNLAEKLDDSDVQDHFSFLDKTRSSAEKDALLWADLKANVSMKLNEGDIYSENHTVELELPVAKQLSFMQMDTRDFTRTSENFDLTQEPTTEPVCEESSDQYDTPLSHVRHHRRPDFGQVSENKLNQADMHNPIGQIEKSYMAQNKSLATPDKSYVNPFTKPIATSNDSRLNPSGLRRDLDMQSPANLHESKTPVNLVTPNHVRLDDDIGLNLLTPGDALRRELWMLTDNNLSPSLLDETEGKESSNSQNVPNLIDLNW